MRIDDSKLEELRKENVIDNSRLEELASNFFSLSAGEKQEFVDLFRQSRLLMPIEYDESIFDIGNSSPGEVKKLEKPLGFDIRYLEKENGEKTVPLFTSGSVMEEMGIRTSVMAFYMSDLEDMLKQSDRYSSVSINPFTENGLDITMETFLAIFEEPTEEQRKFIEHMNQLLDVLAKHSVELEENTTLFIRSDENFMIERAVDGIYVPTAPMTVSSNPKHGENLKYTNILLMPKSKRILPLGPSGDDLDVMIAPGTVFRLQDVMDETQNLWMCEDQPFYEVDEK